MTTNYFNELKSTFESKIGKFAEKRDSLRKQTVKLREKIADTENLIERLNRHGAKMDESAGESLLSGNSNDYAKFQTALKKNYTATEVAKRELAALKSALSTTMSKFETGVTPAGTPAHPESRSKLVNRTKYCLTINKYLICVRRR